MRENQVRSIRLNEVTKVRFICKGCGTVIEMPIGRLEAILCGQKCPTNGCNQEFLTAPKGPNQAGENPFKHLAVTLAELRDIAAKAEMELVIAEDGSTDNATV